MSAHNINNNNNGRNDVYQHRLEHAYHTWNPFPPYTHPAIKAVTIIVILFLIAVFITYVVFVGIAYAKDKDSPKTAFKYLNKDRAPLEYPAVTVCNLNADRSLLLEEQMALTGCRHTEFDITGQFEGTTTSCADTVVFKEFEEDSAYIPCWTFNLKSDALPVPYKARKYDIFNALEIYFNATTDIISVSLHEATKPPTLDILLTPHSFTAKNELTVLGLEKVETSTINGSKTITWECNAAHLYTPRNASDILVYYQDLKVQQHKEEYTYKAVSLIGDIAAAFEILLGLSFFKVYLLLLAGYIILGDHSHNNHPNPQNDYNNTVKYPPPQPQHPAVVHTGAPTM